MNRRPLLRTTALVAASALGLGMLAATPLAASAYGPIDGIAVGDEPRETAFAPDGETAYVTNTSSDTVSVIDVDTASIITTVAVGDQPIGIAVSPAGDEVWVGNWGTTTISIISTATNTVTGTIPSGGSGPHAIVFSADGSHVYVTNYFTGVLAKISTATDLVVDSFTYGGYPEGAALTPDGSYLYIADTNADAVFKVATSSMDPVGSAIPVGDFPVEMAVSPDQTELWVANNGAPVNGSISVISLANDTVAATIPVGGYTAGIDFDAYGYAYITSAALQSVQQVSVADRELVASTTVGSDPYDVATSPDGSLIYVTVRNQDEVVVFGVDVDRLAGADRYTTAIEISEATFAPGVDTVYVATGVNYPDALAAGPVARKDSPVLLTAPDALLPAVAAELTRLDPAKIVLLGKTGAVSSAVQTALEAIAPTTRVAGDDRYATARALVDSEYDTAETVYLATGANFPDALSAGGAGAALGIPLLLVYGAGASVDAATLGLLDDLGTTMVKIIGGTSVVSSSIQSQLQSEGFTVQRLAGANRYSTSYAIAADAFEDFSAVVFATGANFPDALAGAPYAASHKAPLLAVQPGCVPAESLAFVRGTLVSSVTLFGGTATLSPAVAALTAC